MKKVAEKLRKDVKNPNCRQKSDKILVKIGCLVKNRNVGEIS